VKEVQELVSVAGSETLFMFALFALFAPRMRGWHTSCEALEESVPLPLPKIVDAADYLMAELDTSHPLVWIDCEVRQRILQIAELS
jgi:hypothetical protein